MALVRLAILPRHHPYHLIALGLGAEATADAAVGAGGVDESGRRAEFDDTLFVQRSRRAGLHAGAARHAFGGQEIRRSGGDLGVQAATIDGQRESALHFGAGAHAARADDALG